VPDLVLDYHRLKVPLDHPDLSVTRAKLEYPTIDVNFAYLASIGKTTGGFHATVNNYGVVVLTRDIFTDKAVDAWIWDRWGGILDRWVDRGNNYSLELDSGVSTKDLNITRRVAGTSTVLGYEAVDLPAQYAWLLKFSVSGSTLKAYRDSPTGASDTATTLKITATDTTFASGRFGPFSHLYGGGHSEASLAWLRAPASPSLPSLAILEVGMRGTGRPDDPFRPDFTEDLVEIEGLQLPEFLHVEARKYRVLKGRGFTDDEIRLILGYLPQHKVDLNAVTWGAFEFSEKSPTNIITVISNNPYDSRAIERQIEFAEKKGLKVLRPPRDYREAVEQYNELKKYYPHWLAGKDSFAYQVLGLKELETFHCVDFYYGELIEHKAHYSQLKEVPDWELERTIVRLMKELERIEILREERDKHINKLEKVMKIGW